MFNLKSKRIKNRSVHELCIEIAPMFVEKVLNIFHTEKPDYFGLFYRTRTKL